VIDVGSLRARSAAFLPDTATISRYTETSTADGVVHTWQALGDAACRVSPLASSGAESAGSTGGVLRAVSEWVVWLPALTDVTERDRLTVHGSDRTDERVFEVSRVGQRSYEVARECLCALVT
jgi:head-tail adaptor